MENAIPAVVGLVVLSTCVVLFSGVVPTRYQTWPVIFGGALAIPLFLVVMGGIVGLVLG